MAFVGTFFYMTSQFKRFREKNLSAIPTYLKVEHIRLEAGEILILDGVIFLIESVERLIYTEQVDLLPSEVSHPTVFTNLRPEDDEIYHLEYVGISHWWMENGQFLVWPNGTTFKIDYPRGDPRFTPHGFLIELNENIAHILDPFRIDLWVKPATEPVATSRNLFAFANHFKIGFFGWKYRTKIMTKADLDSARGRGVKILDVERYVSK